MGSFTWEVIDGQAAGLVHELCSLAVCDGLAAEHHPHPPRGILEVQGVAPEHPRVEVEGATLFAERPGPDRQGQIALLAAGHAPKAGASAFPDPVYNPPSLVCGGLQHPHPYRGYAGIGQTYIARRRQGEVELGCVGAAVVDGDPDRSPP